MSFLDDSKSTKKVEQELPTSQTFSHGFEEAFRQQVIAGPAQLAGAKINTSKPEPSNTAEQIGIFVGNSIIFIGSNLLARRIPIVGEIAEGKVATLVAGGALGFVAPDSENRGLTQRFEKAGLGIGTMAALEFGPSLAGKYMGMTGQSFEDGIGRNVVANGAAGLINTAGSIRLDQNRWATTEEVMAGTGSWMATGRALHALGARTAQLQVDRAEAIRLNAEIPWEFKDVQRINAADLSPDQVLTPGHYSIAFESQSMTRNFNLYVSRKAVTGDNPAPLAAYLHGLNNNSANSIRELNFNQYADEDGAVVAYLHAKGGRRGGLLGLIRPFTGEMQGWNDTNFGYTEGDPSYNDRVAFNDMLGIIRQTVPTANVDRIGVTAFSLGAKMANRIAATRPDVGVLATMHGTMDNLDEELMRASENLHPLDALVILGDKDAVLKISGGKSYFTHAMENAHLSRPLRQAEFWAETNASGAPRSLLGSNYTGLEWTNGSNRITQYIVRDSEHAIHGAHRQWAFLEWLTGRPKPPEYFDARRRTWDFVIDSLTRENSAAQPQQLLETE